MFSFSPEIPAAWYNTYDREHKFSFMKEGDNDAGHHEF
jgi:hypothetical protein